MLAVVTASLSLTASPLAGNRRELSQIPIGKYSPNTNVLDHANIDLDQKTLESAFGSSTPYDFAAAKSAWQGAAYSKVTATCTLASAAVPVVTFVDADATASPPVLQSGNKISYKGADGQTYSGKATANTASGGTTVSFKTAVVADNRNSRVDNTVAISILGGATIGLCTAVSYVGGRTLQGFSTGARSKMLDCAAQETGTVYTNGCPYTSYKPYYDYYCGSTSSTCNANGDYVNQWVLAAADGTALSLDKYNMNFGTGVAKEDAFRKDFLKKVSKFAGAYMYALREFEDAIDDCARVDLTANQWSDGSVHAWDEGVAFYVGGQVKSNLFYEASSGKEIAPESAGTAHYLSYTLANKRCKNFKTCGRGGDMPQGEAYVNYELWKEFGDGRDQILAGNCAGAVPVKNKIVQLTTVPLVQGSLRYAHKCRTGTTCSAKSLGELAAFVASVLPVVHACNPVHAATIAAATSPNAYTCDSAATACQSSVSPYWETKAAFESCYSSMGITCAMVGGLWDSNTNSYMTDASPCLDSFTYNSDGLSTNAIIGIAIGAGAAALLLLCLCFVVCKERSGTPMFVPMTGNKPSA